MNLLTQLLGVRKRKPDPNALYECGLREVLASNLLKSGDRGGAVKVCRKQLHDLKTFKPTNIDADERKQVRSLAFNLAMMLNQLQAYREALQSVDVGLACAPTSFGRAVAEAARGEALCGLNRTEEGIAAFEAALSAHPIVGTLNSAESMSRLATPRLRQMAGEWLNAVVQTFGDELDSERRNEIKVIRERLSSASRE